MRFLVLPVISGLLALSVGCGGGPERTAQADPLPSTQRQQGTAGAATPIPLKPLRVEPASGYVGELFTVTGEGLPPGKAVQFDWGTWDGVYVTEAGPNTVRYLGRKFEDKRVPLGSAVADAQGRVTATFATPVDYGETHDVIAAAEGRDVARGEFQVLTSASLSPTEGSLGTPMTITVRGMGRSHNTLAVLYDNRYAGLATAVTTRGSAVVRVRAAGPVGPHAVQLAGAGPGVPELGLQSSGPGPASQTETGFRWTFTVTKDAGAPENTLDWPSGSKVAQTSPAMPMTTEKRVAAARDFVPGLEPPWGPALSRPTLRARGLPASSEVEVFWVAAGGDTVAPTGWRVTETLLARATTGADGSLSVPVEVPDDVGGLHVVKATMEGKALMEVPYNMQRSLVGVSPRRVKLGETFTVRIKGLGWTEVDDAVAVTYDNAYIGYVRARGGRGDATITLTATGGPGTHLVDLYPTISRREDTPPADAWNTHLPFLTVLQDFPGLRLGYELPVFRLAVEVEG